MTRRLACALVAALACGASAAVWAQAGGGRAASMTGVANPSAVIGAEIAFARLAQDKGQWTAFRQYAANDAVMFVPARVSAPVWLKGKANPPVAVKWQVHEVWMSCDGSYAVTRGAWQRPGSVGVFTTVWQRQPRRGDYKWVLDLGEAKPSMPDAPDMIPAHVADCSNRPRHPVPLRKPPKVPAPIDAANAQSDDGTLRWAAVLDAKGAGSFTVGRWNGRSYDEAEHLTLTAQD